METPALSECDCNSAAFWRGPESRALQNPRAPRPAPPAEVLPPASLLFGTSGSSGEPKWVCIRKAALLGAAEEVCDVFRIQSHHRWLRALPIFHVGGLSVHARAFVRGCAVAVFEEKWNAPAFCQVATRQEITHTSLTPTQVHDLVCAQLEPPPLLELALVGGGALNNELSAAAESLGWPLTPTFGMTETCGMIAGGHPLNLFPHWEAQLARDETLQFRGPGLCEGYFQQDGAGQWTFCDPKTPDGWLPTSDLAVLDGRALNWLGRKDRTVKILGELVNLDAVESALGPGAGRTFCIISEPDERTGARLVAISEADIESEMSRYNQTCPPFARISHWVRVDHLPRSPLGKVLRRQAASARITPVEPDGGPAKFTET